MTAVQTPPGAIPCSLATPQTRPEAQTTPPAKPDAVTTASARAGSQHDDSHVAADTQNSNAVVVQPAADHLSTEAQKACVGGVLRPPAPAIGDSTASVRAPVLVDPILILAAQALDDLEATRIANENRLRSLRDVYGLAGTKQEAEVAGLVDGLAKLEHQAELSLKRALRRHPLGPWVARTVGVGEKQGARLLAAIGDPYIRPEIHRADGTVEPSRPRSVSELRSYCGWGDAAKQIRRRGQKANWNAEAKKRVWLIAAKTITNDGKTDKNGNPRPLSPYRAVYDDGRERYADAIHQVECRRCGPSGRPAEPGSPLSAGHQHARAIRLVCKEILRDLWLEARALHQP